MKEEIKDILIDKYYEESYDEKKLKSVDKAEIKEYEEKLESMSNKINVLEKLQINNNMNFLALIEKGDSIKEEKRNTKENIWFVFVGFMFLMVVGVATVLLGIKFVIYFEILASIVTVISAILFIKYYLKGEKS